MIPEWEGKKHALTTLGKMNHREFVWKGQNPFKGEAKLPHIAIYCSDLTVLFGKPSLPIAMPKL
jgi:hypothetical protein